VREVFREDRGGRVPVGIAGPQAGCRRLPGQPGQLPQRGGVAIQRGPAVTGEGDGGLRPVAGRPSRPHVPGVAQLVQAGNQAAGGQPGHVLQPPEVERVAVRQCRQGRDSPQPRRVVDQRVERIGGHDLTRPWFAPAPNAIARGMTLTVGAGFMISPLDLLYVIK
jgi:hypothetical protein